MTSIYKPNITQKLYKPPNVMVMRIKIAMTNENKSLEIYEFIIHTNQLYHCILFEDKDFRLILPHEWLR